MSMDVTLTVIQKDVKIIGRIKMKHPLKDKIINYVASKPFTWLSDITEHTIWGFKNAPFKNYKRAFNKVSDVVEELKQDGLLIEENDLIYSK
jgi:hypothetical protein